MAAAVEFTFPVTLPVLVYSALAEAIPVNVHTVDSPAASTAPMLLVQMAPDSDWKTDSAYVKCSNSTCPCW